jgi:hypothetical protein
MATISDLMKGKAPGEIKVTWDGWTKNAWFQPFYCFESRWYGPADDTPHYHAEANSGGWSLYQEPKKPVTRWLWATKNPNGEWFVPNGFFSEEEFYRPKAKYIKLPWSVAEFPE